MPTRIGEEQSQRSAEQYSKLSTLLQAPNSITFMDRLYIQEGMKVLDLGCGTGNLTAELAERVGVTGHAVGVDPNEERIQVAKVKNASSNITFEVGSGEDFPQIEYDLVFCTYLLHWIKNKEAVFEQVARHLSPGGQFAFLVGLDMPPIAQEMSSLMSDERRDEILYRKHFFVSETTYEEMAAANGLRVTLKELHSDVRTFPNVESIIQFWFATTYGVFDPTDADQDALEVFKRKYRKVQPQFVAKIAYFVLTKQ